MCCGEPWAAMVQSVPPASATCAGVVAVGDYRGVGVAGRVVEHAGAVFGHSGVRSDTLDYWRTSTIACVHYSVGFGVVTSRKAFTVDRFGVRDRRKL